MGVFTPGSGALAAAREILQQLLACDEAQSEGRRHQPASSDTASAPPPAAFAEAVAEKRIMAMRQSA